MKTALITGISGQDGAFLAKNLLSKGYRVVGADRRSADSFRWRLDWLGIQNKVEIVYFDLLEFTNILNIIEKIKPDEVYNLAAQSFVKASFDQPILTSDVDAIGPLRILEAIRTVDKNIKFYQASTSEMFGKIQDKHQDESTPFYPRSPYGVAKLYAHWITKNYRESYNMFACSGILFNHESELRGSEFVTKKIVETISRISLGSDEVLSMGNLDATRDWGHAEDYVEGMYLIMNHKIADDFVLSTGHTTSVRKFLELAAKEVNIDIEWKGNGLNEIGVNPVNGKTIVNISPEFFRPAEVDVLIGNSSKALNTLGWKPKIHIEELVSKMIKFELQKLKNF